jgi:hypothetical protein
MINFWKKKYEDKIVKDLAQLFYDPKYIVHQDKELFKLDKNANHPRHLGDYDLIVFDKLNKKVLLFEVKYMRLSQTMKDIMGDQSKYFIGKKPKAAQFTRRVKYFEENKDVILNNLGYSSDFSIHSYFITNKNIRSHFRDYPFKIKSYNEFKSKMKSDD